MAVAHPTLASSTLVCIQTPQTLLIAPNGISSSLPDGRGLRQCAILHLAAVWEHRIASNATLSSH